MKAFFSFLIFCCFAVGIGIKGLTPALGFFTDAQWMGMDFLKIWQSKLTALLWLIPIVLGLKGWVQTLSDFFFRNFKFEANGPVSFGASLVLFSLYVWGLSINGLLFAPLVALFFLIQVPFGFSGMGEGSFPLTFSKNKWFLILAFLPWLFEYFSPLIIWDAVLDHFRFARELARLHQMPLEWVNHTGDIPKGMEMILAGFWSLGGENLAHLSLGFSLIGILWLFRVVAKDLKLVAVPLVLLFITCPFFMAIFAWGYDEGFLGFYEILALTCFVYGLSAKKNQAVFCAGTFFLGAAMGVKYTAIFAMAGAGTVVFWEILRGNKSFQVDWKRPVFFLIPCLPWFLRNYLANGNPFYPMATSWFGGPPGFNPSMESDLWGDTGSPLGLSFAEVLGTLRDDFFTMNNQVGAAWTPLVLMSLPWAGKIFKSPWGIRGTLFGFSFFAVWVFFCTSLRHAAGGVLALTLLAGLIWGAVLQEKPRFPKLLFAGGAVLAFWLCLCAQLNSTAPYYIALGGQDSLARLRQNYDFNFDTFSAYETIEKNSNDQDRTMAFAVYQTYPLKRSAYVDFFWKKPIFLEWASHCQTADQLAEQMKRKGVTTFLYQRLEAASMSVKEKYFILEGMPESEYIRFWKYYMEPMVIDENSVVYRVRQIPLDKPAPLTDLPGLQEKWMAEMVRADELGKTLKAYQTALEMTRVYPDLGVGWERRAYFENRLGMWKKAFQSGQKAVGLGFESLDLCDTMTSSCSRLGRMKAASYWAGQKINRQQWLDVLKRESLSFEEE
jgi:hypothetical protein